MRQSVTLRHAFIVGKFADYDKTANNIYENVIYLQYKLFRYAG